MCHSSAFLLSRNGAGVGFGGDSEIVVVLSSGVLCLLLLQCHNTCSEVTGNKKSFSKCVCVLVIHSQVALSTAVKQPWPSVKENWCEAEQVAAFVAHLKTITLPQGLVLLEPSATQPAKDIPPWRHPVVT